ncbi:uncharacterized protein LOC113294570 [Papaver somniferum]|uniref:uncharacterized protein LOC113294570 n=1 Tax=Papaver somniferum TaxID=3469 RepID=UPI000E6F5B37|nr:uncharacterized protein LOC113294570 [Papaver somniferum]
MIVKVQASGEDRQLGAFSKHDWSDIRKQYYMRFWLKHSLKAFKNTFTKLKERYKYHEKLVEDNTRLGWDPILCTVDASNEWWDDHVKKFPRDKVFGVSGCPEYSKLAMIYGDTVATKNLRQTQNGSFDSLDGEDETNMFEEDVPQASLIPPLHGSTQISSNNGVASDVNDGNMDNQSHSQKFPQDKVFRVSGCPEYSKLAIIYGDTVTTGNLRQTQNGGFDSSDGEYETNMFEEDVPKLVLHHCYMVVHKFLLTMVS